MPSVLIVCTANICRSPVVEVLLKDRLAAEGLEHWLVESAGTWASKGQNASEFGVILMAEQGLDISNHKSQPVSKVLLAVTDLILTLETGHAEALRAEFASDAYKVYPLTQMAGDIYSVNDPYGGPREAYERMVAEVTQLLDDGLPMIIDLATANAENLTKTVNN